jgi:hypothetical protein
MLNGVPDVAFGRPGEVKNWVWTLWPEDVLDAVDLFCVYLGFNPKLGRPFTYQTMSRRGTEEVPMRRAISAKAQKCAMRLIAPSRANNRPKYYWYLPPKHRLGERLKGAGIDPDTIAVCNKRRWAFAWLQLTEQSFPHYNAARQEELVNTPGPDPAVEPITTVTSKLTKAARDRIKSEEEAKKRSSHTNGFSDFDNTIGAALDSNRRRADY